MGYFPKNGQYSDNQTAATANSVLVVSTVTLALLAAPAVQRAARRCHQVPAAAPDTVASPADRVRARYAPGLSLLPVTSRRTPACRRHGTWLCKSDRCPCA